MAAKQPGLAYSMYELECGNRRKRKVKASLKQMLTVGMRLKKGTLHIIFNSVLPGADVSSDFLTFLELWAHSDIGWAIAVLFFMFPLQVLRVCG